MSHTLAYDKAVQALSQIEAALVSIKDCAATGSITTAMGASACSAHLNFTKARVEELVAAIAEEDKREGRE